MDNQSSLDPQWQIPEGTDVVAADGEKLGTVVATYPGYIVVEKGFFFPTDYYVPVASIANYDGDRAYLSLGRDEALNQGWDVEPTDLSGAGAAAYSGTGAQGYGGTDVSTETAYTAGVQSASQMLNTDAIDTFDSGDSGVGGGYGYETGRVNTAGTMSTEVTSDFAAQSGAAGDLSDVQYSSQEVTLRSDESVAPASDAVMAGSGTSGTSDAVMVGTTDTAASIGATDVVAGTTGQVVDQDVLRVPVHEEELIATKRAAEAGEVRINKEVVTEERQITVPITEERVRVEWRTPTGTTDASGQAFEEGSIEIPIRTEEVDIQKRTVVTGELEVSKEQIQRQEEVTGTVRREVVDVEDSTIETGTQVRGTQVTGSQQYVDVDTQGVSGGQSGEGKGLVDKITDAVSDATSGNDKRRS